MRPVLNRLEISGEPGAAVRPEFVNMNLPASSRQNYGGRESGKSCAKDVDGFSGLRNKGHHEALQIRTNNLVYPVRRRLSIFL